ncbi:MAG: hypothetical protein A2735_01410 [Candidatus Yanofskybacteria bacterium RIFCSPHIGHO2_01_FULL_41_21]|uniref:Uncharacterized protein n=1 Tax=Candidatus Yanofskybacteria bacterium RIFCSPHIGHO2_01_FULL_41_21 TaxID=1802660 RepID=A0A1F8EAZ9_9BACT|nr:MAG: hypothetical protein A2735_01410 [Candidatus Yanofskybacteria bacterium RIFCSPHIGHO2_01_FULL_41_21]
MPTIEDLLNILKFKRMIGRDGYEGSCFGVTDASRLRPAFQDPISEKHEHRCISCEDNEHNCTGIAKVYSIIMRENRDYITPQMVPETTYREVPCGCRRCHPPVVQPSEVDDESNPPF